MNKRWLIVPALLLALFAQAREYGDSAVYQGMSIKLDIATPVIEAARSSAKIQDYEIAMNWRLKQRWYPTIEMGYARAEYDTEGGSHKGQGGFARIGADASVLKKGAGVNSMMLGLRFAGACQQFTLTNVQMSTTYWGQSRRDFEPAVGLDAWAEIVAGVQVQVAKGFQMGWYLRMKILLTKVVPDEKLLPYYVPGFGYRDDTNWGFNYYIGYKF